MGEYENVKALLTRVAEAPGAEFRDPVGRLLQRIHHRRRRRRAVAVGCVAAMIVLALVVPTMVSRRNAGSPEPAESTKAAKSIAVLAHGRWSALPEAPVPARSGASATWTGSQLLVWGGATHDSRAEPGSWQPLLRSDGASYDPRTRRWEKLPPAPLSPRLHPASAWTGREWLLWGSDDSIQEPGEESTDGFADGAAYNPRARAWRKLPPAPLGKNIDARAVWTGQEMVIVSGGRSGGIAAYDPDRNSWRKLPALPLESDWVLDGTTPVWAGGRLYVWANWYIDAGPGQEPYRYRTDVFEFDAARARWERPAFTGDVPPGMAGEWAWTGTELVMPALVTYQPAGAVGGSDPVEPPGYALDPGTGRWRRTAPAPLGGATRMTIWTGDAYVTIVGALVPTGVQLGQVTAWDAGRNRWTQLARAPYTSGEQDAVAVWTGRELLVWGSLFPAGYTGNEWYKQGRSMGMRLGP
ncbi:Kelch repeat-containing protein [Flindersiella endophytica]